MALRDEVVRLRDKYERTSQPMTQNPDYTTGSIGDDAEMLAQNEFAFELTEILNRNP
jgi:hypothetical protein